MNIDVFRYEIYQAYDQFDVYSSNKYDRYIFFIMVIVIVIDIGGFLQRGSCPYHPIKSSLVVNHPFLGIPNFKKPPDVTYLYIIRPTANTAMCSAAFGKYINRSTGSNNHQFLLFGRV